MAANQAAINSLTRSLVEMGNSASNPVLEILKDTDAFRQGIKYPKGNLKFAGTGLQAYYHKHAKPYLRPNEHGHFHIFLSENASLPLDQWRHLVALSIDSAGQPQNWFCVNQWVTGGKWLKSEDAGPALLQIFKEDITPLTVVEKWIFSLLGVYTDQLQELLAERDSRIIALINAKKQDNREGLLNDHSVYDLAEISIDLLADLSIMLESNTEGLI